MTAFELLLQRQPLVFFHMLSALAALAIGAVLLLRRKGSLSHRTLGWAWVLAMASATLTSAFIRAYNLPNIAGVTPIHALTLLVAIQLPRAVLYARRGNVRGHRQTMKGLYIGACAVAGLFTLLPGRFLGGLLWGAAGPLA